ncbi:MAG: mandelate racemase/muconate lactonizing enzyme family protein [Vicinamibacteria bacterium]
MMQKANALTRRQFASRAASAAALLGSGGRALASPQAAPNAAQRAEQAADAGALIIDKVEGFVLRTPNLKVPYDEPMTMPPIGAMTGGEGIWNRLDHATPTRFKQFEQATLVKITTKNGLVGWGECHAPSAPRVHQTVISDLFAPLLRGQDARWINPIWEHLYSSERMRGYSTGSHLEALAGVDIALWDLLGKATNLPIYQLLGGKYRDSLPVYTGVGGATTEAAVKNAESAAARGMKLVKMSFHKGEGSSDFERVEAVAAAMRAHGGQLSLDSLGAFKLYEAVQMGHRLDKIGNIGWFEDALLPEDHAAYPILASSITTPICAGETASTRFQIRDLLLAKAARMFNPDVCRAGGITECQRIAALADAYGTVWTPHVSTGTLLYFAASIHVGVATSNCILIEGGDKLTRPFGNALAKTKMVVENGMARVPEGPGHGVDFDEEALKAVTVVG